MPNLFAKLRMRENVRTIAKTRVVARATSAIPHVSQLHEEITRARERDACPRELVYNPPVTTGAGTNPVNCSRGIRWHLLQVQLVSIVPIGLFAAALLYLH
jgi:hypothetical protein